MSFKITNFLDEISKNGLQNNSTYDIIIPLPNVLLGKFAVRQGYNDVSFQDQANILSMRCDSIIEPGIALRTTFLNRHGVGVMERMPYSAAFTDTNLSFLLDKNGNIFNFWYSWLNLICNFADTNQLFGTAYKQYVLNYKDDFATTVTINKYDSGGNKIYTLLLNNAFPISMNERQLSWQDSSPTKCIIGMSFKDWAFDATSIGA